MGLLLSIVIDGINFFCRFVNNVTELGQTRVHRMPLHKIAGSVGDLILF